MQLHIYNLRDSKHKELTKVSDVKPPQYLYRHKSIRFNGAPTPHTPQRKDKHLDDFDTVFDCKEDFTQWFRSTTIGLAELDQAMNYCKYFVRVKGNQGHYVRDGKSFPVDGSWVGLQDFDNYPPCQPFVQWLTDNSWRDNWFELMDRYKDVV